MDHILWGWNYKSSLSGNISITIWLVLPFIFNHSANLLSTYHVPDIGLECTLIGKSMQNFFPCAAYETQTLRPGWNFRGKCRFSLQSSLKIFQSCKMHYQNITICIWEHIALVFLKQIKTVPIYNEKTHY